MPPSTRLELSAVTFPVSRIHEENASDINLSERTKNQGSDSSDPDTARLTDQIAQLQGQSHNFGKLERFYHSATYRKPHPFVCSLFVNRRAAMSISSDEVNFLIFRYLSENGELYSLATNKSPVLSPVSTSHTFLLCRFLSFRFYFCPRISGGEVQHSTDGDPSRCAHHLPAERSRIHRH